MPIRFNSLLREHGIDLKSARLLRHQDTRHAGIPTLYHVWNTDPESLEAYQSVQSPSNRAKLAPARLWLSFVAAPGGRTLFTGAYASRLIGPLSEDRVDPVTKLLDRAGTSDSYELSAHDALSEFAGRLSVDWGPGFRSWIQRPHLHDKVVTELLQVRSEPVFPGYPRLVISLSEIFSMPVSWATALSSVRGVYLLTCPRTKEQYVGSATGAEGFLGRWRWYAVNGHGGNTGLKSREPSDYQASILEVAGSLTSDDEILRSEDLWKRKLQSREMGLNWN